MEFGFLLDPLNLTAGNLSQHLRVLEDAGLIRIDKGIEGRRPRTWVSITGLGCCALLKRSPRLKAIVSRLSRTWAARRRESLLIRDLSKLPVDEQGMLNPTDIGQTMAKYATEVVR